MRRALLASLLSAGLALACGGDPKANQAAAGAATKADEKTDEKPDAKSDAKADEATGKKIEPAGPLTEDEQRLIAADPASLSPEDRRLRSYALRKKIMQNPDSEAAKSIQEGMEAIERGDVEVPAHLLKDGAPEGGAGGGGSGPMLSAPAPKSDPTPGLQK